MRVFRALLLIGLGGCSKKTPTDAEAYTIEEAASPQASVLLAADARAATAVSVSDAGAIDIRTGGCDKVKSSIRLTNAANGIDGVLRLLTCPENEQHDPQMGIPADELEKAAILEVRNDRGAVYDRRVLDRAVASLEAKALRGDGRMTFLVMVDMSIGMGSYAGPTTRLYDVRDGRLVEETVRRASSCSATFGLVRSLKNGWRLEPRGKGNDILEINSFPDVDGGFVTRYSRYTFKDNEWFVTTRTDPGITELLDGFPDASFPK